MKNLLKALLIGPLCGLFLCLPAHAQKTKAQLATEITTTFPENTIGSITPTAVRAYETDVINSIMPTAPVVSGNLACFNGTTGLLQDCGSAPITVPLTIGTTPINGGTTLRVLYDNGGLLGEYTNTQLTALINTATTSLPGLVPAWPNNSTTFFRGDGTYAAALNNLTPGNGLTSTITATAPGSAITNAGTLSAAQPVNAQAGTSYAIVDGDRAKLITATNAAAQAYSIAQAGTASAFPAGWYVDIQNNSTNVAGIITVTPTTSTINGASTLKIQPGQFARIVSDGANYQIHGPPTAQQLPGTTTNDAANAGNVGEYIESVIASGSPVTVVTATPKTITSISLTAGDWDVDGVIQFIPAGTTSVTRLSTSLSLSTNTTDVTAGRFNQQAMNATVSGGVTMSGPPVPPLRFSFASTTSVFLVADQTFTVAGLTAYGIIRARRVR